MGSLEHGNEHLDSIKDGNFLTGWEHITLPRTQLHGDTQLSATNSCYGG